MATKPNTSLTGARSARPGGTGPQHYLPPSARELRAQAVHRLQIGLLGLCAMLLLVGLANIIMERARLTEGAGSAAAGLASDGVSPKSDPLADIGVVPSPEPAHPADAASAAPAN